MKSSPLGKRMKRYESSSDLLLTQRVPLVIRLDGKGFSKFTKGLEKPMDERMRKCMEYAAFELVKEIEGCRFAYTQSDEISLIIVDYASNESEPWFNYRLSKVLTIAATICNGAFIKAAMVYLPDHLCKKGFPKFDARAYSVPKEDVCNAILWRQIDATRNAILNLGMSNFSHKELQKLSCKNIQEKLFSEKDINFNDMPIVYKRGCSLYKIEKEVKGPNGEITTRKKIISDLSMPIISQDRLYIERWLEPQPLYENIFITDYKVMKELKFNNINVTVDGLEE